MDPILIVSLFCISFLFVIRREGTTEEQDSLGKDDIAQDIGSGSGNEATEASQAIRLAENLALNPLSMHEAPVYDREDPRDTEIAKSVTPTTFENNDKNDDPSSAIHNYRHPLLTTMRNRLKTNNITVVTKYPTKDGDTSTNVQRSKIDPGVVKRVVDDYRLKPKLGMYLECNVPGKDNTLKGTLKYLGTIANLPKRSDIIVAGLFLDSDADRGTDGTFLGKRYFATPPKRSYFVPFKYCANSVND